MSLTIKYLPIDGLRGDPRNAKSHAIDDLDGSLGRFGMVEPIVVDERTGLLVSGHGRVDALRRRKDAGEPPPRRCAPTEGRMAGTGSARLAVRR